VSLFSRKLYALRENQLSLKLMRPAEIHGKRIVLSPLNWGMGHVSRCIGLIHQLKTQGNTLFIACSDDQKAVFEQYFDDLVFIDHEGYPFHFGGKGRFGLDLLNKSSSLFRRLRLEREQTEEIIEKYKIDLLLSDHRYGFRSTKVPSIFITHQVNLPVRLHETLINSLHKKFLSEFDRIWVMDYSDSRLSGKLSISKRDNIDFIGPFSRFSLYKDRPDKEYEAVLIASGPAIYAQHLIDEVIASKDVDFLKGLIIIHAEEMRIPDGITALSGNWRKQDELILKAKHLISRAGYSTIMDCTELEISATYIATPGQREQEYLRKRHQKG
jgi:UDP-N-acetylglucosamine:LPS N-acetylglucosamine transferase